MEGREMKVLNRTLVSGIALLFVGIVVTACNGGSSSASSGVTQAELAAAIASAVTPLEAQIATLQSQVSTLQQGQSKVSSLKLAIVAPNSAQAQRRGTFAPASATSPSSCLTIGTLTGHPTTSDPISSGVLSGISCTGYYFNVSEATSSQQGDIQQLTNGVLVGFDGAGCTGNAYVEPGMQFADASVIGGVVFVMDTSNAGGNPDYSNPANYWYVPAGESESGYTAASFYSFGSGCSVARSIQTAGYPTMQNDPSVTGEDSAPIPGPVLPGSP